VPVNFLLDYPVFFDYIRRCSYCCTHISFDLVLKKGCYRLTNQRLAMSNQDEGVLLPDDALSSEVPWAEGVFISATSSAVSKVPSPAPSSVFSSAAVQPQAATNHIIVAPPLLSRRPKQPPQTPPDSKKRVSVQEVTPGNVKWKGKGSSICDDGGGGASSPASLGDGSGDGSGDEGLKLNFREWNARKKKKQRSLILDETKLLHDYNVKLIDCTLCHKSISSSQLRQHMETVHEIRVSYDCNACKLTGFKSKLALRIHVLNFHRLRCCLCRKKFESNAELLAHRKKHNDEPYDCRICGKSFSSKSILVQHSFIQHPLTAFSCRECVQFFPSAFEKRTHDRMVHGRYLFRCPVCRCTFRLKRWYLLHLKAGGCKVSAKKCPHCPLRLTNEFLFRIHAAGCRFKKSYTRPRLTGFPLTSLIRESKLAKIGARDRRSLDQRSRDRRGPKSESNIDVRSSASDHLISSDLSSLELKSQTQLGSGDFVEEKPLALVSELSLGPRANDFCFAHAFNDFLNSNSSSSTVEVSNSGEICIAEIKVPFKIEPSVPSDLTNESLGKATDLRNVTEKHNQDLAVNGSLEIGEILGEIFGQTSTPVVRDSDAPQDVAK